MNDRVIYEASLETKLLHQRLKKAAPGEVITYVEMAAVTGRPANLLRPALATARARAQREDDMVFAAVRGVGVKRLDDDEIVDSLDADTTAIRRKVRRAVRKAARVDYQKLSLDKQRAHTTKLSILTLVADATGSRFAEQVAAKVANSTAGPTGLPIAETLSAFGKPVS